MVALIAMTLITWLLGGMLMGALTVAAHWGFAQIAGLRRPLLRSVGLGALAALVGGGLGVALWGAPFGLPTALWVSGGTVIVVSWIAGRRGTPAAHG